MKSNYGLTRKPPKAQEAGRRMKGELKEIADCGMRNVELGEREEMERQIDAHYEAAYEKQV